MKACKRFLLVTSLVVCSSLFACQREDHAGPQSAENNYDRQAVGKSAHALLSSDKYVALTVEMLYSTIKPDASASNMAIQFLKERLNKTAGIDLRLRQIPSSGKAALTLKDIQAIENKHREIFTKGDRIGVCVIYTDTNYENDKVLGVAYGNTSICLFGKTIDAHSGGIGQASTVKLTATVLEHEFGHLLGLVDAGTTMQNDHEDAAHAGHCDNENCLMYYASETTDILGFLLAGSVPDLDARCLADLKANGGI